jgi:hypothetical protein
MAEVYWPKALRQEALVRAKTTVVRRRGSVNEKGKMGRGSSGIGNRHLGIDPAMTLVDYLGRPQTVLDDCTPVKELL